MPVNARCRVTARRRASAGKPLGRESRKPIEVPILGEQDPNAGLAAERHDLRIEDEVAGGVGLAHRVRQQFRETQSRQEKFRARRSEKPLQGFTRSSGAECSDA